MAIVKTSQLVQEAKKITDLDIQDLKMKVAILSTEDITKLQVKITSLSSTIATLVATLGANPYTTTVSNSIGSTFSNFNDALVQINTTFNNFQETLQDINKNLEKIAKQQRELIEYLSKYDT